jgi:hypothetical protein
MFAAYNAGPTRVDAHLTKGTPLPPETRAYIVNVVNFIGVKKIIVAQKVSKGRHRVHSRQTMLASNS